jgi:hypothetical protein
MDTPNEVITSFRRIEVKYLLDERQKDGLLKILEQHMAYDPYSQAGGHYSVKNVYFDTPHNDVIRESSENPLYKAKLRLRTYGGPTPLFFLELKKKFKGEVFKRRITLTPSEYEDFFHDQKLPEPNGDYMHDFVIKEIANWLQQYPHAIPEVVLTYDRIAMFNKPNEEYLRLTIDSDILARRYDLNILEEGGHLLLPEGHYLLEAKIIRQLPLWFAKALNSLGIYKASVSKYGMEYKQDLKAGTAVQKVAAAQATPLQVDFDLAALNLGSTDD